MVYIIHATKNISCCINIYYLGDVFQMNNRFKEVRKRMKLTQKAIADILNITNATYSRYEAGIMQPDPPTMCKIAEIFGVSIDYLLYRTDIPDLIREYPEQVTSQQGIEYIRMYRSLDNRGKKAVNDTLEREYTFIQFQENEKKKVR